MIPLPRGMYQGTTFAGGPQRESSFRSLVKISRRVTQEKAVGNPANGNSPSCFCGSTGNGLLKKATQACEVVCTRREERTFLQVCSGCAPARGRAVATSNQWVEWRR